MKHKAILFFLLIFLTLKSFAQITCVGLQTDTVIPSPTNGTYLPGTTVSFCYTLHSYSSTSDWLNAFVLNFGPGWDTTSIMALSSPSSCDGFGAWGFYDSCHVPNGKTFGQGFYYDRGLQLGGSGDGMPGNNLGDDDLDTCSWTFCFSIKVKDTAKNGALYAYATAISDAALMGKTSQCVNAPFPLLAFDTETGINNITNLLETINVYPNPASDNLTVGFNNLSGTKTIGIFNLLGKEVYQTSKRNNSLVIDISAFPDGVYFLNINSGNRSVQKKFVVQR